MIADFQAPLDDARQRRHRLLAEQLRASFERYGAPPEALVREAEASAVAAGDATTLALAKIAWAWEGPHRVGPAEALALADAAVAAADLQPDVLLKGVAHMLRLGLTLGDEPYVRWLEATLAHCDELEDAALFGRMMVNVAGVSYNLRDWPTLRRRCEAILLNAQGADMHRIIVHNAVCMAQLLLAMAEVIQMRVAGDDATRRGHAAAALGSATAALATTRWISNTVTRSKRRIEAYDLIVQAFLVQGLPQRHRALRALRRMRREARRLPARSQPIALAARGVCIGRAALDFGHQRLARLALESVRGHCDLDREHDYLLRWRVLYLESLPAHAITAELRCEVADLLASELDHDMGQAPVEAFVCAERSGVQRRRAREFLAHDLRSPLTSAGVALRHAREQGELPRVAPAVEAALESMLQTACDRLVVGELYETEGDGAPACVVDLAEIAADVIDHLGAPARRAGTQIVVRRLDAAWVLGVRSALWRALFNVVDNALRHGGHAGHIEIELYREGEHHRLVIADRGPGFALVADGKSGRYTADGQLHGIGMASVRRIVRRVHLGRVRCCARDDGPGALVEILLPAVN